MRLRELTLLDSAVPRHALMKFPASDGRGRQQLVEPAPPVLAGGARTSLTDFRDAASRRGSRTAYRGKMD